MSAVTPPESSTFATQEERAQAFPLVVESLTLRGLSFSWRGTVGRREDMRRKRPYEVLHPVREVHLQIGTHRGPEFNVWREETTREFAKVHAFGVALGCTPEELDLLRRTYANVLACLAAQVTVATTAGA